MGVKQRSIVKILVLSAVTFGLYGVYVIHQYHTEFAEEPHLDSKFSPVVRTLLMLVPGVNLYGLWLFFSDVESLTGESAGKLFVLSFLFVGWVMAYNALNEYAA